MWSVTLATNVERIAVSDGICRTTVQVCTNVE